MRLNWRDMTITEIAKASLFGGRRNANITEFPDKLRLTVRGRSNEIVLVRLLDSSLSPLSFWDEGYASALEFRIPSEAQSLNIDFAKPGKAGEYIFEVCTETGVIRLEYCSTHKPTFIH